MPLNVSTKLTISVATVSRVRRNAVAARDENHRYRNHNGMNEASAISASGRSRNSSSTLIAAMLSTAVISPSKPESSSSVRVSTSDVSREITRPDVNRSWKETDNAWV